MRKSHDRRYPHEPCLPQAAFARIFKEGLRFKRSHLISTYAMQKDRFEVVFANQPMDDEQDKNWEEEKEPAESETGEDKEEEEDLDEEEE